MSLTSALRNKHSPISQWMEANTNRKAITNLVKQVNNELSAHIPLLVEGSDARLVGTAFDYAFRWLLGPFEADKLVAWLGASIGPTTEWVIIMPAVVDEVVKRGNNARDTETRVRSAIILAWFEQNYRSWYISPALEDLYTPDDDLGEALKKKSDPDSIVETLYSRTPLEVVKDIMQLLDTVSDVWGVDLEKNFVLNPTFDGSRDIGGADADWIVDGILYDCKCSKQKRPFGRQMFLQNMGYTLLDYSDRYSIKQVGWYFPRQRKRITFSLAHILHDIFDSDNLEALRKSFAKAAQELADNREAQRKEFQEKRDRAKEPSDGVLAILGKIFKAIQW